MYQIKYGDFTLSDEFVIDILDLSSLPIRTSSQVITSRDGGAIWNQLYGFRTITIGGSMYADTGNEYYTNWRNLTSAFSISKDSNGNLQNKELKITLSNGDERYSDCKVITIPDFIESAGQKYLARFQTVLQAENPFLRDIKKEVNIEAADVTGFPVPAPVPTPLGGVPVNSITLTVTGDFGSYPQFVVNPGITNPRITNQSTGEFIGLDMVVNATTGSIPITFDERGIRVGTNNEYIENFIGSYFRLQKGANSIIFTGGDVSGASLDITWWNEYISV